VHASSGRGTGPFVRMRLAGMPEALFETELPGRLQAAADGTLFLDEICELSRRLQDRLMTAVQDRVAGNVRIIASTSRNLEPMVADGRFRDDLYYRLNVIPIEVPSLRSRKEDIPLLVDHFRRDINGREGRSVPAPSEEVTRRLLAYDWPGNVRQL